MSNVCRALSDALGGLIDVSGILVRVLLKRGLKGY